MPTLDEVEAGPHAGLLDWLASHSVDYELRAHPVTWTARETARVEGIDPHCFAKTLAVATRDAGRALVVVDAADRLDLARAREAIGAGPVRLLDEEELQALAPDCQVGTIPPVGELFGMPVWADLAIRTAPTITFHAGSHRFTVTVESAPWARAVRARFAGLAAPSGLPAWEE